MAYGRIPVSGAVHHLSRFGGNAVLVGHDSNLTIVDLVSGPSSSSLSQLGGAHVVFGSGNAAPIVQFTTNGGIRLLSPMGVAYPAEVAGRLPTTAIDVYRNTNPPRWEISVLERPSASHATPWTLKRYDALDGSFIDSLSYAPLSTEGTYQVFPKRLVRHSDAFAPSSYEIFEHDGFIYKLPGGIARVSRKFGNLVVSSNKVSEHNYLLGYSTLFYINEEFSSGLKGHLEVVDPVLFPPSHVPGWGPPTFSTTDDAAVRPYYRTPPANPFSPFDSMIVASQTGIVRDYVGWLSHGTHVQLPCRDLAAMALGNLSGSSAQEIVVGALTPVYTTNPPGASLFLLNRDEVKPHEFTVAQSFHAGRVVGLAIGDLDGVGFADRLFVGTEDGRLSVHSITTGLIDQQTIAEFDDGFLGTGDNNTIWFIPVDLPAGITQPIVVYSTSGGVLARQVP